MSPIDLDSKLPLQLPTDIEIIAFCQTKQASGDYSTTYIYPSGEAPIAFIKYGPKEYGMMSEMLNQEFAFNTLKSMPRQETANILIPQIYRVVEEDEIVYIVMEYIHGETLKELIEKDLSHNQLQEYYNKIAQAIKLFISVKVPDNVTPGPVGGGIIKHPLFKNTEAPIEYISVDELQTHVYKVANFVKANSLKVDFRDEDLCFCFSDLYEGNFIFTDNFDLYIIDFHHVAFLPISFMTYALDQPRAVCDAIKMKLNLPQKNLKAMRVAGYYFMISWPRIGKYLRI